MEELTRLINEANTAVRQVIELLANRETIMELASSSDQTYALDAPIATLSSAGAALASRMDQVRRVARELDALTDPATIMEVR